MKDEDHDILLTVANDVKWVRNWTEAHTKQDDDRHKDNLQKFDKIDITMEEFKKFKWKRTGALAGFIAAMEIALRIFVK